MKKRVAKKICRSVADLRSRSWPYYTENQNREAARRMARTSPAWRDAYNRYWRRDLYFTEHPEELAEKMKP